MIYQLYCGLIMTGYAACSTLLGGYMMHYGGAEEADLGFIFMVQPMTIFFRPFICAHSDRRQIHRQMLAFYAVLTSLAYVPFIVYPFLQSSQWANKSGTSQAGKLQQALESTIESGFDSNGRQIHDVAELFVDEQQQQHKRFMFWLLMVFHLIGSIGFCGVRSLGDALAVNYAKRIGADFARFRKYGSMSYGICNFLLGFINQDWLVPNFVPALTVYSSSMIVLAVLVFSWPQQYFIMSCQDNEDEQAQREYIDSLPGFCETMRHVASKICCGCIGGVKTPPQKQFSDFTRDAINRLASQDKNNGDKWLVTEVTRKSSGQLGLADKLDNGKRFSASADLTNIKQPQQNSLSANSHQLTVGQQMRIFGLLLKRDFRIMLYLLIILYGGLTGYSGPNFVFTYINLVCHQRGTCKGSELSGLVMLGYCFVETTVYLIVDKFGHRFNRTLALQITFLVLTFHYNFYGFALDHLSPYFFLVESLHGIEYGISLTTSVELGYHFAREVELLLPELLAKGIIGEHDNIELVKVSLMATMSGCYTLAYDGIGCILGCLLFGIVLGNFGFNIMWIPIGLSAALGFVVIAIGYTIGKCFGIRPEILRIRDRHLAETKQQHQHQHVSV